MFEPEPPLIDNLLYRGAYLFCGSPKVGKSFFMAQLAYHVSTGTPLWGYNVRQAPVLYLALEDRYSRLQRRMYQMFGVNGTDDLHFATECRTVSNGLSQQVCRFADEHPNTGLVIIDTLKRVRETGGAEYSYDSDYDIISKLKDLADCFKVTMIIVHHTRKLRSDNVFDMVAGTNGLLGAVDGAFVLSKDLRTSNNALLDVTGRDQQDQRFHIERNPERLVWDYESVERDLWIEPPEPLLESIALKIFSETDRWEGTASELCGILPMEIKPHALSMKLNVNVGRLLQEYGIHYQNSRTHAGRKIVLWKDERDDT